MPKVSEKHQAVSNIHQPRRIQQRVGVPHLCGKCHRLSPRGIYIGRMPATVEVCILAGGLSTRMGRAKARLRLGNRTLLGWVRRNAAALGLPVRIIRRDLVRRCGPLGGIYSALKTTKAFAVLFLPCDMPFISAAFLRRFMGKFDGNRALFGVTRGKSGFPIILPQILLPEIEKQIHRRRFALQDLACATGARSVRVPAGEGFNINSPEDMARAQRRVGSSC
jgi:molybdopterin-guanine dinucleotide biosynthesis protein A